MEQFLGFLVLLLIFYAATHTRRWRRHRRPCYRRPCYRRPCYRRPCYRRPCYRRPCYRRLWCNQLKSNTFAE